MIALIDCDIVCYRCSASVEIKDSVYDEEIAEQANLRADKLMQEILYATDAESYRAFFTGPNNFRKQINPEYKANRKDKPIPLYLKNCREFLIENWKAEVCEGYEADDAMSMNAGAEAIICTIDKDLDQVPGWHYNWVKGDLYEVSPVEGLRFFYKQLLIGDRGDNLFGVEKIGPVKAAKIIDHLTTEKEMFEEVRHLYEDDKRLFMNGQCMWMWREPNKLWQFPE
jgi:5'-3' exonuclease